MCHRYLAPDRNAVAYVLFEVVSGARHVHVYQWCPNFLTRWARHTLALVVGHIICYLAVYYTLVALAIKTTLKNKHSFY
jgi:hypothetical protein